MFGTDTDIGKTYVSAALCFALLQTGARVVACKPLETGESPESDLEMIVRLCGRAEGLRTRRGLRYALAAAPTAAAIAERRPQPSAADVAAIVRAAEEGADAMVVETCGGVMSPLSASDLMADVAARLPDYRTVLVAGLRLGVLSHTFAAVEALRARGAARPPLVVLNDRFRTSAQWYVDSTRADLRTRGLEPAAFVAHDAPMEDVDLSALIGAPA